MLLINKRNIFIFLVFYFCCFSAFSKVPVEPASLDYYIVPIKLVENSPILTIKIEGKESDFILDTGATIPITLSKHLTKNLKGIRYTGERQKTIDAAGKIHSNASFVLKNAEVGKYLVREIKGKDYQPWGVHMTEKGKTLETDENKSSSKELGVIGLGFFKNKNFIIDYSRKQIIILENNILPPAYAKLVWHNTVFSLEQNEFAIEAIINNHPGRFLIDTGSTGSLLKKSHVLSQSQKNPFLIAKSFVISKKDFGPIKLWILDYAEPTTDGILGYDFFMNNVVYIDFQEKLLKLSPIITE